MKIDRHNYEEFFILYWDNELTAAQRQAVENFIAQNADLRGEFEILGETRFSPDATIDFQEKTFLLNNSFINITNYEEQLLNYIDDEVTAEQKKEVEEFVGQNPAAQKELEILQKTKLLPEAEIGFPGKSLLYRRDEKVRVISMVWFRVAVAAAIILIGSFAAFQLVNTGKNTATTEVAGLNTEKNPVTNAGKGPRTSEKSTSPNPDPSIDKRDDKLVDQPGVNKIEQNAVAATLPGDAKDKNDLPKTRQDVAANNQAAVTDGSTASYNIPSLKRDSDKIEKSAVINIPLANDDVTNKPELALYIPREEAKEKDGGGLKELLRKTTRVFERRTKMQTTTDDNKLLVGAFAVSLK